MPNIKSAKKRMKTNEKSRVANLGVRTRVKNARRKMMEVLQAGDAGQGVEAFKAYCSVLDKAAKTGVVTKNTATRRKCRASEQLRKLQSA